MTPGILGVSQVALVGKKKKIKILSRQAGLAGLTNQDSLPSGARSLLGAGWARETPSQIPDPQVCPGARVLIATTGL